MAIEIEINGIVAVNEAFLNAVYLLFWLGLDLPPEHQPSSWELQIAPNTVSRFSLNISI